MISKYAGSKTYQHKRDIHRILSEVLDEMENEESIRFTITAQESEPEPSSQVTIEDPVPGNERFRKIYDELRMNPNVRYKTNDLAEIIGVSPKHMRKVMSDFRESDYRLYGVKWGKDKQGGFYYYYAKD